MASRIPSTVPKTSHVVRSDPSPAWPGRSHVSTFVHCLHLLDLDILEDWPGITEATLDVKSPQQNLQQRIKAVEWSLYHLFNLYNAEETRDKLRPFFPPSSQLQSVNLRAALLRCLNDLKKGGILGSQTQLRKTMLDECKGEKFEELLAEVALIVLKKVLARKVNANAMRTAEIDGDNLLPLTIAYRSSLQCGLKQRKRLETDQQAFVEKVDLTRENLVQRKALLRSCNVKPDPALNAEMSRLVNQNWVGDHAWAQVVLKGLPSRHDLVDLVPASIPQAKSVEQPRSSDKLTRDLEANIRKHKTRLAEWRLIAKDLKLKNEETSAITKRSGDPGTLTDSSAPLFSKHKHIQIFPSGEAELTAISLTKPYRDVINAMHKDLTKSKIYGVQSDHGFQNKIHKGNPTATSFVEPENSVHSSGWEAEAAHAGSGKLGDDAKVDDMKDQGFKYGDQLQYPYEPEPTESRGDRGLEAVTQPTMTIRAGVRSADEPSIPDNLPAKVDTLTSEFTTMPPSSPLSSLPDEESHSVWPSKTASSATTVRFTSPIKVSDRKASPEAGPVSHPASPVSPSKEWMSLIDRTRASMADFGSYKQPLEAGHEDSSVNDLDQTPVGPRVKIQEGADRRSTLVERTRQSMSLFAPLPPAPSSTMTRPNLSKRKSQRLSQLFPVNQFETPGKPRSRKSEFGSGSGSSTPREKLFEDEADYASVFKSRPRIALSPVVSPEWKRGDEDVGFDSILEQDMDGLQLASDDEYD